MLAAALAASKTKFDITVVTPFNFIEVPLGIPSALVMGEAEYAHFQHELLKEEGVKYIIATCTSLSKNQATLSTKDTIDFDVAIVATGVKYPLLLPNPKGDTKESRVEVIKAAQARILSANTIVVQGGGPVGSEIAAEIKIRHKDKRYDLLMFNASVLYFFQRCFGSFARKCCGQNAPHVSGGGNCCSS